MITTTTPIMVGGRPTLGLAPHDVFPTWRITFNTSLKHRGFITYGQEAAAKAGYPYFVWSGWVYHTDSGYSTGILEENIE